MHSIQWKSYNGKAQHILIAYNAREITFSEGLKKHSAT